MRECETNAQDAFGLSTDEIRSLLHELRVHQTELEMQNEDMRQKQDEIEASRNKYVQLYEKYSDLYNFAPIGYFTLGENAVILEANLTSAALLGKNRDDLIGKSLTRFILKEDQDTFYFHRGKVSETTARQICELRMKKADGTAFHAQLESIAVQGLPGKYRTAVTDVSDRVRLESHLRQSQKMEAIGTLAGGIAHEFNNVLFPIIGYAQMTMDEVTEDSQVYRNQACILRAAERAANMVRQILDVSHLNAKEHVQPMRIHAVIKDALMLLRGALPSTIEIRQDIDMNIGEIMGDPAQISQVVMNLCTNAFHAMEDNGGILEVRLSRTDVGPDDGVDMGLPPGPHAWLTVKDSGHGMDSKVMGKIFDPYFTTKAVGKGTGMGLAMVHGIVRRHGGSVRVTSRPGQGAAFHICLPLTIDSAILPEPASFEPLPKGSEHILFVDDEESIVQMVRNMLESLGYHVTALISSMDALAAFRAQPGRFDLVITDMTMPGLTGDELARTLLDIRPDIPIILCTGFSEKMTEEKAKSMGIRELLMKPVSLRKMAEIIRQVLRDKHDDQNQTKGE